MALHVRLLAGKLDRGAGSHVYHLQLARRLAERGHRVSVVCFQDAPELRGRVEMYVLPRPEHHRRRLWWRFAAWTEWRALTAQLRRLDLPPADVVIGGEHLFLKGHWRKFPQTPWIYLPHSLVVDQEIDSYRLSFVMHHATRRVYRSLQRWALRRADRTLRFTRLGCEALEAHYGGGVRPRFVVNPVGVDLPAAGRAPGSSSEVRLLSVGRLIPSKGLDTGIKLLAELRGCPWRYDIVGDGAQRAELQRQVQEAGLTDRIVFHGFQPNPESWYRQADLLLMPSRSESFGLVLVEAMSYGVPCLAMKADGVRYRNVHEEILEPGHSGLLAEGEAGLRRQLQVVLEDPARLTALGEQARRRVAGHFTWEKHLERYETVFAELEAGRKKAQTCAVETFVRGGS